LDNPREKNKLIKKWRFKNMEILIKTMRPLYVKAKNPMTIKIKKIMIGGKGLLRYEFVLHKV
jgi:hypothetical protein